MGESFNPAERLFLILKKARKEPDNKPIKQVWADILGVSPFDARVVLIRLSDLMELFIETKKRLQDYQDTNKSLFLNPLGKIDQALSITNLDQSWGGVKTLLNETVMHNLQHCSNALSRVSTENRIEINELEKLRNDIESLVGKTIDSEFSEDLKQIIINNLENIRRAILAYEIHGISGLKRALESSLGSIAYNYEPIKSEKNKDVVTDLFKVIERLNSLISFAQSTKKYLIPFIENFLN
jgi:hypothetical protein